MWVRLIYVALSSAELNVERVGLRVGKGGHAVPRNKIIERRAKPLALLPKFLAETDDAFMFDNSGATPQLVAGKEEGEFWYQEDAMPEFVTAIEEAAGESD